MRRALLVLSFLLVAAVPTDVASSGHVISVYDGDTLTLQSGDKVRLKWANAPEMKPKEPYAQDAKELTTRMTLDRDVTLHVDPLAERDGYGRMLAGVETPDGDLSLALIKAGYAHLYIIPPQDGDAQPYVDAQVSARSQYLGIWSTDRFSGKLHITSFHANAPGDESKDPNLEYVRVCNITGGALDVTGFKVTNLSGREFTLGHIVIPVGNTLMLKSGKGGDQTDPEMQLTAHLGSDVPIWNNERDRVTILDADGVVQDVRDFELHSN